MGLEMVGRYGSVIIVVSGWEVAVAHAPRERLGMRLNLKGPRQPKPGVW